MSKIRRSIAYLRPYGNSTYMLICRAPYHHHRRFTPSVIDRRRPTRQRVRSGVSTVSLSHNFTSMMDDGYVRRITNCALSFVKLTNAKCASSSFVSVLAGGLSCLDEMISELGPDFGQRVRLSRVSLGSSSDSLCDRVLGTKIASAVTSQHNPINAGTRQFPLTERGRTMEPVGVGPSRSDRSRYRREVLKSE